MTDKVLSLLILSSLLVLSSWLISHFGRLKHSLLCSLLILLCFTKLFEINSPRHFLKFSLLRFVSIMSLKTSSGLIFLFFIFQLYLVTITSIFLDLFYCHLFWKVLSFSLIKASLIDTSNGILTLCKNPSKTIFW